MSTNACSSTLIFSVLIRVFPWFSMKVTVTWCFLCQHECNLKNEEECFHTILVWRNQWCNLFFMSTTAYTSTFIYSVLISVFPWFSMKVIITWWFFVSAWVTLKLWKGVFSYNFGMEHLMVQFVFNEHQCMYINFHLFSVDQYVSLIFHEAYSYLVIFCANMSDI